MLSLPMHFQTGLFLILQHARTLLTILIGEVGTSRFGGHRKLGAVYPSPGPFRRPALLDGLVEELAGVGREVLPIQAIWNLREYACAIGAE